jgi:hypothetical protein
MKGEYSMINREEYIEKLRKLNELGDTEAGHALADDLLVEILIKLGYQDIVDEYESIDKWYA